MSEGPEHFGVGLAEADRQDQFNVVHNHSRLTNELKTIELKTIDYQIQEEPDNFMSDNNSEQFKVENAYLPEIN